MKKKDLIDKARAFVKRSLNIESKNTKINKEDYYMFLISKFLLLKEMIIKKDSSNNALYFNCTKNKQYLPAIKYIVDYVKQNGRIEKNSTTIIIEPEQYNNSQMQLYIWTFNKIRDSLVHGMYDFDLSNGQLIIENDHSNEKDPYVLNCRLPIEILDFFTYVAINQKSKYDEKEIKEYKDYSVKMRRSFGYYDNFDTKIIENYNTYNSYNNSNTNDDSYNNSNTNDDSYNNSNTNDDSYNNSNNSEDNFEYINRQEDILEALIRIIKNSDKLTDEERKRLYNYLRSIGLLDYNHETVQIKRNNNPDNEYAEKLATVISEISSILGLKTKPNDTITFAAIYNYMQLTFSLNDFDFESKTVKEALGYLKISRLNPKYIKYNKETKEYKMNENSLYLIKIKSIQNYTTSFISKIEEKLQQYKKNPSPSFRQSINNMFKNYYENIIHSFADKNAYVLTSIRNSIEHANIYDVNGYIMLNDQNNQNDNKSINFNCYGEKKDFFEIIKNLELGTAKEEFSFEDFLEELKSIIDIASFNEVLTVINELKTINAETLVDASNQSILKK